MVETQMQDAPPPNRNLVDWVLTRVATSLHFQKFPSDEIVGVLANKEKKYQTMTTGQLSGNVLHELRDCEFYQA